MVTALANNGEFAIRDVIDDEGDKLKDILGLTDDYNGIFNKHPSTRNTFCEVVQVRISWNHEWWKLETSPLHTRNR